MPAGIRAGGERRVFCLGLFSSQSEYLGERDDQGHHGKPDDAAPCQTRYHSDLHSRELWEGLGRLARVHGATAADEAHLGVNPMKSSFNHRVGHRAGNSSSRTTTHFQLVETSEDNDGGRYRIRTYDFHRVKESRAEKSRTYEECSATLSSVNTGSGTQSVSN